MSEDALETCRTCLLDHPKTVHIMNFATYSRPRSTFADILKDLAKLQFIGEQECNMPQNICSLCCRQLRSMYLFVKQVQECNNKLLKTLENQQGQTTEFPKVKEDSIDIKKEQHGDDREDNYNNIKCGYTGIKPTFLEVTFKTPNTVNDIEDTNFEGVIECEDNIETPHSLDVLEIYSDDVEEQDSRKVKSGDVAFSNSLSSNNNSLKFPHDSSTSFGEDVFSDDSDNINISICDKSAKSTDILENSYCLKCNKTLSSREQLRNHMRREHNEHNPDTKTKFFTCVYCSRKYDDKHNLNMHLIYQHQIDNKDTINTDKCVTENNQIKCKLCDYTARTHAALHFHKRSKHGTEDDKTKCKFCSYSSLKKFDLLLHIKKSHLPAIKALKRNLGKQGSGVGEKPSEEITKNSPSDVNESAKLISGFVEKWQESRNENCEENSHEACSSGDEDLIRDILNIKKRLPKSNPTSSSSPSGNETKTKITNDVPVSPEKQHMAKSASSNIVVENTSCPLCEKILNDHDELLTHMLMEHREECSTAYVDNSKSSTSKKQMYTCEHCSLNFTNNYEKRTHLSEQHGIIFKASKTKPKYTIENKVIRCRLCDYTTKTYAGLHYHTRSKHGTEDDKFKCNFCSYTCFKKFDLLHHTKRAHLFTVKAIKKDIGKSKDKGKTSEMDHNLLPTDDITSLVQKYQNSGNMDTTESNLEVSSGDEDIIRDILSMKKRVPKSGTSSSFARRCEECGNVYKNSVALNVHRRMVHREHVYSQCTHCDRKYKRPYDLKLHILDKHTPKSIDSKPTPKVEREKRFMCTECSYICSTSTLLTIHTHRHHTGEKPYKCEYCSKAFVVPSDLKSHRYLHTGERPFKCSICLKGFRDKNHMHRHKRTHSDVKPYNCAECGKGFSKNYNLTIHKRTHMKGQKLRCLVCGKYFKDRALLNVHQISENHHEEVV